MAVDAVELEGATIDNPTGYNAKFCFDKGIGVGAEIRIIRSGMVIPKIQDVIYPVSNDVLHVERKRSGIIPWLSVCVQTRFVPEDY